MSLRKSPLKLLNQTICPFFASLPRRFFYDFKTKHDTIFAPASHIDPVKGSPLGIIRVSGNRTSRVLEQLTELRVTKLREDSTILPSEGVNYIKPRRATLARIVAPKSGDLIDIGLILWFPSPSSYTGEDVCEFHLHGSQSIITKMLSTIGEFPGVRPAEPGEFSRRAWMNKKLTLIQAESLSDLISSKTDYQRRLALRGLSGSTRSKYDSWIQELVGILAHLEASIDFGEDELIGEDEVVSQCISRLKKLCEEIDRYINVGTQVRDIAKAGTRIVILGKPNAGKSTLMNLLCKQDKSIVSDLRGTTRDIIEHNISISGHSVILNDTAGLRYNQNLADGVGEHGHNALDQHDAVEREGIKRALEAARQANILIYLIDGTRLSSQRPEEAIAQVVSEVKELHNLIESETSKIFRIVINKTDLNEPLNNIDFNSVMNKTIKPFTQKAFHITLLSCLTERNLSSFVDHLGCTLEETISQLSNVSGISQVEYINERHLSLLKSALKHLKRASGLNITTIDEMAQHVRESVDYVSRIVGSVSNEQVFDVIFRDFCIGK